MKERVERKMEKGFENRVKSIAWRLTGEGAKERNGDACLWVRYV